MPTKYLAAIAMAGALMISSGCAVMRGQQSAGSYIDDAQITASIKSEFAADKAVAATAIGVETLKGTVQLTGFAKSAAERDRAVTIARNTKGVVAVKNDIIVRP